MGIRCGRTRGRLIRRGRGRGLRSGSPDSLHVNAHLTHAQHIYNTMYNAHTYNTQHTSHITHNNTLTRPNDILEHLHFGEKEKEGERKYSVWLIGISSKTKYRVSS